MTAPLRPTIDYTSRDFAAIRADMIRLIRSRIPLWTGNNPADFGLALVEAYSYAVDILDYYLDRVGNEAYLSTAVQRESLYSIAAMFNYTPRTATVARVPLFFSNATSTAVTLPQGTRCQATVTTSTSTIIKNFETIDEVIVPPRSAAGPGEISINAEEGRTYRDESLGVSNGFVRQQYLLPRTQVVRGSISVTTTLDNGQATTSWYEVPDLASATPGGNVFQALRQTDGSTLLRFGNGQQGAIPPTWSVIRATYRVGGGSDGNVAPFSIDTIIEPEVYGVSVQNLTPATGGQNEESIDSIRVNAAKAFRARDRAVTLPDYEAVAMSSSLVAKAKSVGNNGSSVTLYLSPYNDGTGQPTPNDELLGEVTNYVDARSMAGVTVTALGPLWAPVYMKITITCLPSATRATIDAEVKSRLDTFYGFQKVDFDGRVASSDIITALAGIDGVDFIEVRHISLNAAIFNSDYDGPVSTTTIQLAEHAVNAVQLFRSADHLALTYVGGIGTL